MKAYYQGQIDYFCAIYAIINSTRIAAGSTHKFTYNQSVKIFQHLIQFLYDNDKFLEVLYHGTSMDLMNNLLQETKKYLLETYDIHLHFKRIISYKKSSVSQLGNYISEYLKRPHTSCIIRMNNKEIGDHWTVVQNRKLTFLKLFDSYFYEQIDLSKSTLRPYKSDGLNHIVRKNVILIKVLD